MSYVLLQIPAHPNANRLAYLEELDPYYVGLSFPRLETPQWIGDANVDAAIFLGIDDMRTHENYETFLRPLIERLKQIDGRAPVTIFTNFIETDNAHVQQWLTEGLHLGVHTLQHPCPLLGWKRFEDARETVHDCIDLLGRIPNHQPVAYRMPCCDSQNTMSPRFLSEIMLKSSPEGRLLTVDSSIFNITTANDPLLPRDLVRDAQGRERFRKYSPFRRYVNTIEDYPYPYVIGGALWEFPCTVPSDWEAQNLNQPNAPESLEDMKRALDAAVLKRGIYTLVFHPHNWIQAEQVVDLADHADAAYGERVQFLTFAEGEARIREHMLAGHPLRDAQGADNGIRLLDLNNDGFQDVVIGNAAERRTRLWDAGNKQWIDSEFPVALAGRGARFGSGAQWDHRPVLLLRDEQGEGAWKFDGAGWVAAPELLSGLVHDGQPLHISASGRDLGLRLRDIDGDGVAEALWSNSEGGGYFTWNGDGWSPAGGLPRGVALVDAQGADAGVRLIDLDDDGDLDIVQSNDAMYGVYLFDALRTGWHEHFSGQRGEGEREIPPIVTNGENNGAWVHSRSIWWQNEHTAELPELVDERAFNDLVQDAAPEAKSPQAALETMQVSPGFDVRLAAAEPLIADPVAFAWDAQMRLWVVEMRDYPTGLDNQGQPGSRIKVLEDLDGDWTYDRATLFLDGLGWATGVMPWKKGAMITCAPDVFYAEDTDGDGAADLREVLYSGFGEGNEQHRVNGPRWGLDGWVYLANGDSGGQVKSARTGSTLPFFGRDIRIQPDSGALEGASGQTQFGRVRNDWGTWFGCANWTPGWTYVLEDHYLRRNPHLAARAVRDDFTDDMRVYSISPMQKRFNDFHMENLFTSACGMEVYRDSLLGEAVHGNVFVCEPVHNLVSRLVLAPEGASYRGLRAAGEESAEFFASTDNWSRPVFARTGPDGALWIADMYRAAIEHPEYINERDIAATDFRAGSDMGRIYRVVPVDRAPRPPQQLDSLDDGALAAALDSPNGEIRDTVHRLLMDRASREEVALGRIAAESGHAAARAHALFALQTLQLLRPEHVLRALADPEPGVRKAAATVAEAFPGDMAVRDAIVALAQDPEPLVLQQAAYSLGTWADAPAAAALAEILSLHHASLPIFTAALSSLSPENVSLLAPGLVRVLEALPPAGEQQRDLLRVSIRLALDLAEDDIAAAMIAEALQHPQDRQAWAFSLLAEFYDANVSAERRVSILGKADAQGTQLATLLEAAADTASDRAAQEPLRIEAIRLLLRNPARSDADVAAALLDVSQPAGIVEAALDALLKRGGQETAPLLVERWAALSPSMRQRLFDSLAGNSAGVEAILAGLESGGIPARQVGLMRRQRLQEHAFPSVRARANEVFAQMGQSTRGEVLERFQESIALAGDVQRGQVIFAERCATCHALGGVGFQVGPDLAALTDYSPESLLISIIDPNRAVEEKYLAYTVDTTDFLSYSGVLKAETGNSITLLQANGVEETLLRSDIERFEASALSLMPEGLEEELGAQGMADLLAFVAQHHLAPKSIEGNAPELVAADESGMLACTSRNARIFGPSLVFEEEYENLGEWNTEADYAQWQLEVPAAGEYDVEMEFCCDRTTAGNRYVLEVAGQQLTGTVPATGTWNQYETKRIGRVSLEAGQLDLSFRSLGAVEGELIELRALRLRPVAR